ncbi:MAG: hypothetical protein Q4B54_03650 [Coriobacteriales bacterium]|nr:hypothetical protein [Coriobacteriales bacterium]
MKCTVLKSFEYLTFAKTASGYLKDKLPDFNMASYGRRASTPTSIP